MSHTFRKLKRIKKTKKKSFLYISIVYTIQCPNVPHIQKIKQNKKTKKKCFLFIFYSLYNSMSQCPIHLENES